MAEEVSLVTILIITKAILISCGYIDFNVNKGRVYKIDYTQRVCQ